MGLHENKIQQDIRLDISAPYNRVFRNSVGQGFAPSVIHGVLNKIHDPFLQKQIKKESNKHRIAFGFGVGSSDLIGIQAIRITQEMVGNVVGVFCAVEVKDPEHKTKPDLLEKQTNFINTINTLGGRAGFATNTTEAQTIFNGDYTNG